MLPEKYPPCDSQFEAQARFVDALQQPRPERPMHLDRATAHLLGQRMAIPLW